MAAQQQQKLHGMLMNGWLHMEALQEAEAFHIRMSTPAAIAHHAKAACLPRVIRPEPNTIPTSSDLLQGLRANRATL
jgi:hypothetical protein